MTNWETIIAMYVEDVTMVHLGGMEDLRLSCFPHPDSSHNIRMDRFRGVRGDLDKLHNRNI